MIADETPALPDDDLPEPPIKAANDNGNGTETASALDPRILAIARAIGRQIAREQMRMLRADNDNDRKDEP